MDGTPRRGMAWFDTWRHEAFVYGKVAALSIMTTQEPSARANYVSVAKKEGGDLIQIKWHHVNLQ